VTAAAGMVTCSCCGVPQPAAEVYEPYPGAVRCRDTTACDERRLYMGTGLTPRASINPPAPVRGTCAICGATDPPGGVYERTTGTPVCLSRADCDERAIESQYLTAHGDDGQVIYTSSQMRAAAAASVGQVVADVPADVTEARQAAASADFGYSLAAAGRRR